MGAQAVGTIEKKTAVFLVNVSLSSMVRYCPFEGFVRAVSTFSRKRVKERARDRERVSADG